MFNPPNVMLESPLHAFRLSERAATPAPQNRVVMSELPHMGYIVLRGQADDSAFMAGVAGVLGQTLPTQPMTALSTRAGAVLWVSPDEWLLVCKRSQRQALLHAFTTALQDVFAQVVDNSGGLTALRVAGPDHMLLLRQLGPYDYERLAVGRCASTVASKTGFTVVRTDEAGVVLVFRRSFADYTWRLLERTAQPYRLCITTPAQCADPMFTPLFEIV
ncbi:MAG TPA: sarcosine oxidase subunit gamma family protein [Hydrogenophaga sp.]|nr:sarcosine oxidase subunit gamma family protein [Hydrogenophaga sp.]